MLRSLGKSRERSLALKGIRAQTKGQILKRLLASGRDAILRVVFLGSPEVSAQSLQQLIGAAARKDAQFEIIAAVTQPPAPAGRKNRLTQSPVHKLAKKLKLKVLTPYSARDMPFLDKMRALQPDLCVTAAYGQFLPKSFLTIPKFGTLNIHPSILPLYRGAAPVQRCVENGDGVTGVTIVETVLKMDAGPIVAQHTRKLQGHEKSSELLHELMEYGTELLVRILQCKEYFPRGRDGDVVAPAYPKVPQDDSLACSADKISSSEAYVDFNELSSTVVHNKVRAFADWPGVWSWFRVLAKADINEKMQEKGPLKIKLVTTCIVTKDMLDLDDAGVRSVYTGTREVCLVKLRRNTEGNSKPKIENALLLKASDGTFLGILELQPKGKRVMSAKSFLNGLRGESFLEWTSRSM